MNEVAKNLIISTLKLIIDLSLIMILVKNWINDGNTWAIYISEKHLVIGDFWVCVFILYLVYLSVKHFQDIWFWILK